MGFGVIFVLLTWHRQWKHGRALAMMRAAGIEPRFGLPQVPNSTDFLWKFQQSCGYYRVSHRAIKKHLLIVN